MEKAIIIKLHKDFEQSDQFPNVREMVYLDHFAYVRKMV